MTRTAPSRNLRIAAIGTTVAAVVSVVALTPAVGAGSGKWTTISSSNMKNGSAAPSIARFGSGYEVIWVDQNSEGFSIQARQLNAAGKPIGGVITVLPTWTGVQSDPTILAVGKTRYVAFGGNLASNPALNGAAEYYLTSPNGTKWTRSSGSLSDADGAGSDTGTAVVNDAGTVITGIAADNGVRYHVGASATKNPASPGKDPLTSTTGNSAYSAGLGVDTKTHQVWALWYSNSGIPGKDGVNAQVIKPSLGTRFNAPGSHNKIDGSFGVQQDLSAASRVGGGVYTAYGTPNRQAIDVWRLGAKKPALTAKAPGVSSVMVTPGPQGRLWLYWWDATGWHAMRTNRAATRFGPKISMPFPASSLGEGRIAAVGSSGPLEAVAEMVTGANANVIIARQILPRLSVSVSPHTVKRGHSFTVKVTDAGDPVKGATVHFGTLKHKTGKKGTAKFKVSHHTSLGKHAVTFTMSGYAAASTHIVIKK